MAVAIKHIVIVVVVVVVVVVLVVAVGIGIVAAAAAVVGIVQLYDVVVWGPPRGLVKTAVTPAPSRIRILGVLALLLCVTHGRGLLLSCD